jgi:hypothetical protein
MSDAQVVRLGKNSDLWGQWYLPVPSSMLQLRDHLGPLCDQEHVAALEVCRTTWDLCAPEYFVALVVYGTT